jgi:hypothetical protein
MGLRGQTVKTKRLFEVTIEFPADRVHLAREVAGIFKALLRAYQGRVKHARELPGERPESTPEPRGGRDGAEINPSAKEAV